MNKIYYPVVFHPEDVGYSVSVPDIEGCFTEGDTMDEAVEMVHDAIGLMIEDMPSPPAASAPQAISAEAGDFVVVVPFDIVEYRKKNDNRSVKKTLTIPSWLNSMAEAAHINFSAVLQSALKHELNIP
ncbi:MAG: type II toxin-antitoxin system HicB family antitoxin [Oscillospiraceae bacterium]|nr:type II toxin-antitoxin system HicB family antitoxin [Oscillospiraceae bacterium]